MFWRNGAILLMMAVLLGAAGCWAGPREADPSVESGAAVSEEDGVTVSRSLRFGSVNELPYGSFRNKGEVAAFKEAIRNAEPIDGILDISLPDYDVVVLKGGKREKIHLWLDQRSNRGMFTYVSHTEIGYRLTESSTKELQELIWGVKYDSEKAKANGDFVNAHGRTANVENWERFRQHVKDGIQDDLAIVQYTIEGDPVFDDLMFDGDTIRHNHDNTHDAFGTPEKRTEFCQSIEAEVKDGGTEYRLAGCGEDWAGSGSFNLYLKGL